MADHDTVMLWLAVVVCFSLFFFRAGELTVPSQAAFNPAVHPAWGDVSTDEGQPPSTVLIFLKQKKMDQFGHGVAVFVGATGDELCPVQAVLAFVSLRRDVPGQLTNTYPRWTASHFYTSACFFRRC